MNNRILSYAMDFASFLVGELKEREFEKLRGVILFGSAARGDSGAGSDIDIFVDLDGESESMERRVSFIADAFLRSASFRQWKLVGVENRISCITGRLDKWRDIRPAIISDGVVLFGRYKGSAGGKSHAIFYWGKVKPETKRVVLSRRLYGHSQAGRKYAGLVEKTSATRLGSNCIMVPAENAAAIKKVFEDLGIQARVIYMHKMG
jgi:hypothetical protein